MKYTLSVLVENSPGVLSKVVSLFSRRGYNIDSLAVGETEDPSFSRMTIVGEGDEYIIEQVEKQLNKLIPVIKVRNLAGRGHISCELMLIKVGNEPQNLAYINEIAALMQAQVEDVAQSSVTLRFAGDKEKCERLCELLRPYGIREIARTGQIAMETV